MSRCRAGVISGVRQRMPTFMPQVLRSVPKPECISAAAQRAQVAGAAGPPDVVALWRNESSEAALRFIDKLVAATPATR